MYLDAKKAFEILTQYHERIVTVKFIKRTNGELRTLNGRLGVSKYVKGVGMSYDPKAKNLITIFDMRIASSLPESERNKAYRCVPLDAILEIKADGKVFQP